MMDLNYIQTPLRNQTIEEQIKDFYLLNNKERTYQHVLGVAMAAEKLALQYQEDIRACIVAALLHDISAVITPKDMMKIANELQWQLDSAEKIYPFLLHQKISALIAYEYFQIRNLSILKAIESHTTLRSNPSKLDMIIFIADKLAWDQPGEPPFKKNIEMALNDSLEAACYQYIKYQFDHDLLLFPHCWIIEAYRWLEKSHCK